MGLLLLAVAVGAAAFAWTAWHRHARMRENLTGVGPPGFTQTEEVTIDPTTQVRQRVWYNPQTGERKHVNEP